MHAITKLYMSIYSSSIHNIYMIFKTPRCWSRRMCAQLLLQELQNYNLLLGNRQMLDPTKKKIPHIQGQRRSSNKTVKGAKSHLESNPILTRHTEGSNKPCAHQDPETPQRLSQNCVWVSPAKVQVSSGLLQGEGALGAADLGMA